MSQQRQPRQPLFSSAENSFQESQLYLDAVMQNGREENESQALVEMVD